MISCVDFYGILRLFVGKYEAFCGNKRELKLLTLWDILYNIEFNSNIQELIDVCK